MQTTQATRTIAAPLSALWPLISDVTLIARWHPSIASVDLLTESATGVHAARRCNFHDGTNVREEVIEVEASRSVRMRLSEFSVPMNRLEVQISLEPQGDAQTLATFALFYEVKFGPIGKLLGATVMRKELSKMAAKLLAGLEHHALTGEQVGKDFVAKAA